MLWAADLIDILGLESTEFTYGDNGLLIIGVGLTLTWCFHDTIRPTRWKKGQDLVQLHLLIWFQFSLVCLVQYEHPTGALPTVLEDCMPNKSTKILLHLDNSESISGCMGISPTQESTSD